jgi:hypothetical protein
MRTFDDAQEADLSGGPLGGSGLLGELVGVELEGEGAEGPLQLGQGGVGTHAEHLEVRLPGQLGLGGCRRLLLGQR